MSAPRPRWRSRRALLAWVLVAGFAGTVLFLGSDDFNATSTRGIIGPLLEFFFPAMPPAERFALHVNAGARAGVARAPGLAAASHGRSAAVSAPARRGLLDRLEHFGNRLPDSRRSALVLVGLLGIGLAERSGFLPRCCCGR
jgi:hypothetical protein